MNQLKEAEKNATKLVQDARKGEINFLLKMIIILF